MQVPNRPQHWCRDAVRTDVWPHLPPSVKRGSEKGERIPFHQDVFEGEVGLDQRRVRREPGLVLSGDCRDRSPHFGSLPEQLNRTPHQEEGIRNPEKYGKAELATGPPLPVLAE